MNNSRLTALAHVRRLAIVSIQCGVLAACASPVRAVRDFAANHLLERRVVFGAPFQHVVLSNSAPLSSAGLHVYIEGDGTPFSSASQVSADPTPRHPLMLHLMVSDPWRAVYVGRPCYFEMRSSAPCTSAYWTNRRFSAEVVASMATVIQTELSSSGARSVRLFGHSGGGTLAVLLSRDLATISGIVTVAGNLDTDAWARLHHYTPLRGSLNPADVQLSPSVAAHSVHWAGGRDHVVPSGLIRNAAGRIGGRVEEVRAYSHQCCWEDIWPSVLAAISGEN